MLKIIRFLFSRSFLINLIIAILLGLGGVYFALMYLEDYTLHGEYIEVPEYTGLIWEDSLADGNPNFQLLISDSIFVEGAAMYEIVDQNPSVGNTVKKGRKIYLKVASTKPPTISMPRLVDLSLRQAKSLMEIYGLQIGELTYKPDLCTNCILEQSMEGAELKEGDRVRKGSVIDLVVGQGLSKEEVPVPYIIDFTASMANELLKSSSLNIGILRFDETVETAEDSSMARVYKQIPHYTEEPSIFMGSSIDLYLTLDTNRIVHSVNTSQAE